MKASVNNSLEHPVKLIFVNLSLFFLLFVIFFTIDRHHRYEYGVNNGSPIHSDVLDYYTVLPEFIYGKKIVEGINIQTNRRTYGMALLYSPAFLTGHLLAKARGEQQDGFSPSYLWALRWGSILYSFFGLVFCRYFLRRFFDEVVTTITLCIVWFGTNLFFYTYSWGEMPHAYLFFLYAAFIALTLRFFEDNERSALILLGLVYGLIILIRPSGIMVGLFPLLYGNTMRFNQLLQNLKKMFSYGIFSFAMLMLVILPFFLQLLAWQKLHGSFFYYSYGDERFFFSDPQIQNFLFSYRKGWLVYTPLMVLSIIGIFYLKKSVPQVFIFLLAYLPLTIYVLSSWWDWSFGGSFGCRAMIESYAFLVLPLAAFVKKIWYLRGSYYFHRILFSGLIVFGIQLNLIQTWQYKYGILHFSGMTKDAYWKIFMKEKLSQEELKQLKPLIRESNSIEMKLGLRDQ